MWEIVTDFFRSHLIISIGLILLIFFIIFKFFYLIYQMRPISEKEIEKWAKNQRTLETKSYFEFEKEPSKSLRDKYESEKPLVDPKGSEIDVSIPFKYGPACMAYWLKHKKHQWVIAMYCSDKNNFTRIYGNKGPDNKSVESYLRPSSMLGLGKRRSFNTLLVFHNHPMSISPSVTNEDRIVASSRKLIAKENNWDYLEFICVRGNFRLFDSHYSDRFKSVKDFKNDFKLLGKRNALENLKFRWNKLY